MWGINVVGGGGMGEEDELCCDFVAYCSHMLQHFRHIYTCSIIWKLDLVFESWRQKIARPDRGGGGGGSEIRRLRRAVTYSESKGKPVAQTPGLFELPSLLRSLTKTKRKTLSTCLEMINFVLFLSTHFFFFCSRSQAPRAQPGIDTWQGNWRQSMVSRVSR